VKQSKKIEMLLIGALGFGLQAAFAAATPASSAPATAVATDADFPSSNPPNTPIQLFNGRNFDGLELYLKNPAADPKKTFSVSDGILHVTGEPLGYFRTKMAYADYKLHVEWRWTNGKGNSGIMMNIVNHDEIWPKSMEANLATGLVGSVNNFYDARSNEEEVGRVKNAYTTGWLSRPASLPSPEKPLGEWNEYDIVVAGDSITLSVNGVEVNHVTGTRPTGGMIGFQSEGGAVDFRNIVLTPLPPFKDLHKPRPPRPPRNQP
jgi:hypothetical protein